MFVTYPYDAFFKGFYPPLHDSEKHFLTDDRFENYIDTYVDVIADRKHSFAMEVKNSSETEKKLSSGIRHYVEMRQDGTKGQILYLGDVSCDLNGVRYLSRRDWGNDPKFTEIKVNFGSFVKGK